MEEAKGLASSNYSIWKENACFLYDLLLEDTLTWPSLTVQWLPFIESSTVSHTQIHTLLMGTNTSAAEQDFLIIGKVEIPEPQDNEDLDKPVDEEAIVGSIVKIDRQIPHSGEINRARASPQYPSLIATRGSTGDTFVFDCSVQFGAQDKPENIPRLVLSGHSKEGFGLAWSHLRKGILLTGGYDNLINVWDLNALPAIGKIPPMNSVYGHDEDVEDVAWHSSSPDVFGSVGDDKSVVIGDCRAKDRNGVVSLKNAHADAIFSLSFNNLDQNLLATGSKDRTVIVRDLRKLREQLYQFKFHKKDVVCVQWSPSEPTLLASASADKKVCVWDLKMAGGAAKHPGEAPPELLFFHGGHSGQINDLDWNKYLGKTPVIASVDDVNVVHIWQMSKEIYTRDKTKEESKKKAK